MKPIFFFIAWLFPIYAMAQPKVEIQEFSGRLISFEPGFTFALGVMRVDVAGEQELFKFPPHYGKFLTGAIKSGDQVFVRSRINLKMRERQKALKGKFSTLPWFLVGGEITEIRINGEWVALQERENEGENASRIFLDQRVEEEYFLDSYRKGVLCEGGIFAFNYYIDKHYNPLQEIKKGSLFSFIGYELPVLAGNEYPVQGVRKVIHMSQLKKESAQLKSYVYKQNHICVGLKFRAENGDEFLVSFPTHRARSIKSFLKADEKVVVFFGDYEGPDRYPMPELHAIIQGKDTLTIEEAGFYGDTEGKRNYQNIDLTGKITKINFTAKGNVHSILIDSRYFVEIDAMLAQQLGLLFRKGTEVKISGQERLRKDGEIFSKDYTIVVPRKVTIGEKTFSSFPQ